MLGSYALLQYKTHTLPQSNTNNETVVGKRRGGGGHPPWGRHTAGTEERSSGKVKAVGCNLWLGLVWEPEARCIGWGTEQWGLSRVVVATAWQGITEGSRERGLRIM